MKPIVIIGTGLAGYTLAREFRKLDAETPLLLISADDGRAYSKPMLSNALAKGKEASTLATADANKMAEQLKANILTKCEVRRIDPVEKAIHLDNESIGYHKLVLATGANPFRAEVAGDSDAILSVNNLQDYEIFRDQLKGKRHVTLLGAGLIGSEFTNDLIPTGVQVEIIDRSQWPLGRLVPRQIGQALIESLEQLGAKFHFGTSLERIDKNEHGFALQLDNGEKLQTELVLSAIGLQPNTKLANDAGLTVNRGIVVNDQLQTSDENIFSLGDGAEIQGKVLPFIMPLMHSARALAKTLAGEVTDVVFPPMPVVVKTPALPLSILPPQDDQGNWLVEKTDQGIIALFKNESDQLKGFVLAGGETKQAPALIKQL